MYEDVTFEAILQRMLDRIPSTQNKREGAVIFDATAPAAYEIQNASDITKITASPKEI